MGLDQHGVVSGESAYANRPHTGVPEIGRFAYALSPAHMVGALPVISEIFLNETAGSALPWSLHGGGCLACQA
jgi:hypothetical protein